MNTKTANQKMITALMFRLLPVQVVLVMVGAVNGLVSGFFASNYVGINAMTAVGLFLPVTTFTNAVSTLLVGGAAILCGKYMGQNEQEKLQNLFILDLLVSTAVSVIIIALYVICGTFDLTGFLTSDETVRPVFNQYLLGQAIGVFPMIIGNQMPAFLALENKGSRTFTASIVYIVVNILLNFLFVKVMHLEAFGLALASSLGLWAFMGVETQYFFTRKAFLRLKPQKIASGDTAEIIRIGFPGAATYIYMTLRGIMVNRLIESFVGSVGISAFAAANNILGIFWAIPGGMLAVSRLLISVSVGEEDRQSLTEIMRCMFKQYLPLMCAVSAGIICAAVPFTRIYFRDPTQAVYGMTVWGLRILPLCMPLSVIGMHFTCYGQASGKQAFVNLYSLLDGVVHVVGFTALLIPVMGMNSAYVANVLNGICTTILLFVYAAWKKRGIPSNMEELMVIPKGFGVPEDERMELTVRNMEEVTSISEKVHAFCTGRGIDPRRSYLAALFMEEMAGNIVDHGFTKDSKKHAVDVRVIHKENDIILRLRDNCIPFDPAERARLETGGDVMKNIGIRMVFQMAEDVRYQNIFGLNVLTMRI